MISRLIKSYLDNVERDTPEDKNYMDKLMEETSTYIRPSRMKIGAKTKKDLFVRVYGHNTDDVNEAKSRVVNDLGPHRDLRITLKMEISYTDHSHLIGCRGGTIRRVMEDTGCHIHFPDSNRMSKEHKSNQVTIAGGSVMAVEQARARVRELSPLVFQFTLPIVHHPYDMNPDALLVFIDSIQNLYNVQITVHPPNKMQQTMVTVKGCEVDASRIKEAVGKILSYFAGGNQVNASGLTVESTMEISPVQHGFVRAVNDSNIHGIMMSTGAKVIFPDLSDGNIQQIKRSRVYITGEMNSVYYARQQLIGCLPLRMIFDLADDFQLDWEAVRGIGAELNVNVKLINRNRASGTSGNGGISSLPPPIPGRSRTIQLIAGERNTGNIYEARRRILGGTEGPHIANIPQSYNIRPYQHAGGNFQYGNRLTPTGGHNMPPLLMPPSPNMVSPVLSPSFWPPTPFASPYCSPPLSGCVIASPQSESAKMNMQQLMSNLPTIRFGSNSKNGSISSPGDMRAANSGMDAFQQHPPGLRPRMNLQQDVGDLELHRKAAPELAPGWGRANSNPSIVVLHPQDEEAHASGMVDDEFSIKNPMNEKKYMAMKAMYCSKVGPNVRVPNSEYSGYGFSKTVLSLFPQSETNQSNDSYTLDSGIVSQDVTLSATCSSNNSIIAEDEVTGDDRQQLETASSSNNTEIKINLSRTSSSLSSLTSNDSNNNLKEHNKDQQQSSDENTRSKTPLGPQQSNLLEFSSSRPHSSCGKPNIDLPALFIQNGLEKYIDTFVTEEIDLDSFANLTESDLRTLGVTSYPARKKMLLLIAGVASATDEEWN